jgi:hypothetical protein
MDEYSVNNSVTEPNRSLAGAAFAVNSSGKKLRQLYTDYKWYLIGALYSVKL